MNAPLSVVIVEDDRTTRDGLRALIDGAPGLRCVGAYRSIEDALRTASDDMKRVVLMDIDLPGMSGTAGVRPLLKHWTAADILMLTVFDDDQKVFESICNGAVGYLLKNTPYARLPVAIREAAGGGAPMSPEIARKVVTLFRATAMPGEREHELTPQETRLLQLLADGHTYEAAGLHLDVSVNTVRSYIRTIYEKLHVHSKSEAVSRAIRRGLIR